MGRKEPHLERGCSRAEQNQTVRKPLELNSDIAEAQAEVSESLDFRKLSKCFSLSIKSSAIKDSKLRGWGGSSEIKVFTKEG